MVRILTLFYPAIACAFRLAGSGYILYNWGNAADVAVKEFAAMPEATDRQIVEDMWTIARNAPLALAGISPFGIMDREQYRRRVGKVVLEFTLDSDQRTQTWSYELSILSMRKAASWTMKRFNTGFRLFLEDSRILPPAETFS